MQITIDLPQGKQKIEAEVKGEYAYHRTYMPEVGTSHRKHDWTLTYLPSGKVLCRTKTKAGAIFLLEKLQEFDLSIFINDAEEDARTKMPGKLIDILQAAREHGHVVVVGGAKF